ncbi:MAG: hypothetical protein ACRCUY_08515 [Thermoguttaceae bacterium]
MTKIYYHSVLVAAFLVCLACFSVCAEESPDSAKSSWRVFGTVRDHAGNPFPNVMIELSAQFTGTQQSQLTTYTDENGEYSLDITPLDPFCIPPLKVKKIDANSDAISGDVDSNGDSEETRTEPNRTFLFQQLTINASAGFYSKEPYTIYAQSRSVPGDLLVIGEATLQQTDDILKQLAADKLDVIPVRKNEPCQIDFVMESRDVAATKNIPPSFCWQKNLWICKMDIDHSEAIFRKAILPYLPNREYQAAIERNDKLTASLRFPKAEIMVGEPTSFDFVIKNESETDISMFVGGDYRGSSRPISFTMRAVRLDGDAAGKIVYEIPELSCHGGLCCPQNVPAGGEYVFDLCFACWFDLKEPGQYRIEVARYCQFGRDDPPKRGNWDYDAPLVLRTATGILQVKPTDFDEMGNLIDQWGKTATTNTTDEQESKNQEHARKNLAHVDDERVIPWLIRLSENGDGSYYTKSALCKFKNDDALAAIVKDIDSKDENKSYSAAIHLACSKHPKALEILLMQQDHWNWQVRLAVVQAAEKMNPEVALPMLRKRFDDTAWEGNISKEAHRIYEIITKKQNE